ncbi:MAG: PAS domain S-box protein [Planctomycetaceae bacterium]
MLDLNLRLMSAAIDSANEAMFTIRSDGRFVSVNQTACERLEYSRAALLAMSVWDINPNYSPERWGILWSELKERQRMVFESEHRTRSGRHFPVEVSKFYVAFDDGEYVFDFVRDISSRKAAEQAIQQSEERFRQMALQLRDVLWMQERPTWRFIYVSPAYETIWGRTCQSLLESPLSWLEGVHTDDREQVRRQFVDLLSSEECQTICRVVGSDGALRWIQASSVPIRNDSGEVCRVAGMFRDITEHRENELALDAAKLAAERSSQAKSLFLANMSHEIRTPLTSILGYAELLQRGDIPADQMRSHLDTICTSGRHLLTLLNDILDLSKIEAGHIDLDLQRVSPHQVIREVLSLLRVRAQEKSLELEAVWTSPTPEVILTDAARLRQMLVNIVGNAIKFTERGGVVVTAGFDHAGRDTRLRIEVRDTGIGIPADRQESIFVAFTQANESITRRFGGSGLGMTISRMIARELGGDVVVQSSPGQGTMVTITVQTGPLEGVRMLTRPPTEVMQPSTHNTGSRMKRVLDGIRVLVVDDGESNRELVSLVLQNVGAAVAFARNGQEGIERCIHREFDVILMDLQMPVMDGWKAMRKLRAAGIRTPIVALSAHAMRGVKEDCLREGFDGYLTKPINIDELRSCVRSFGSNRPRKPIDVASPLGAVAPVKGNCIRSSLPSDEPGYAGILRSFVQRLDRKLDELEAAATTDDIKTVEEIAHWLKGAGGTMGFGCFTEPAARLEREAAERAVASMRMSIKGIRRLAERIEVTD